MKSFELRFGSVLVANRGEIAVRILQAAGELGLETYAVFSEDDAQALHTRKADRSLALTGSGARAYLNGEQLIELARESECGAIHPGYGFLSENAGFARDCEAAGLTWIGPDGATLELFGDKLRAREAAQSLGIPVAGGSGETVDLDTALRFLEKLNGEPVVLKAVSGGGGRGIRVVRSPDEMEEAFKRARSEAMGAFGDDALYVEAWIENARHIEVQVVGDGSGEIAILGERECTLQRRHQKIVEVAPSPSLDDGFRAALFDAARSLCASVAYRNLGTVEFLVPGPRASLANPLPFVFIEVNPRLQVEHTVTEEVTGLDLVKLQFALAAGAPLNDVGLRPGQEPVPSGSSIQVRVNSERMNAEGEAFPTSGSLESFEVPRGRGVRVETAGYAGYSPSPNFDSLLAKVVASVPDGSYLEALNRAYRALCDFRIEGLDTNLPFLLNLLRAEDVLKNRIHTRFVEEQIASLLPKQEDSHAKLHFSGRGRQKRPLADARAGARVDSEDPLAVLNYGRESSPSADRTPSAEGVREGLVAVRSPMQGTVLSVAVTPGESVHAGQALLVMEAMKMEHVIEATESGIVREVAVEDGDTLYDGVVLLYLEAREVEGAIERISEAVDLDRIRPDLAEVLERHAMGLDAARPESVARRRDRGRRTTRENIADLCDPDSFVEYGPLVIAAQRRRRSLEDLIERTPADGLVAGVGRVNGDRFDDDAAQCVVMSYDYTVLAGTQGWQNHRKKDRMFELALQWRTPLIFFTEGGGGRPGDTDGLNVVGLDVLAFQFFGKLSGLVPLVAINSGPCFAGNAALLGCCDVVIATRDSNIGMGGPAMIEGGGLGIFRPDEVGRWTSRSPTAWWISRLQTKPRPWRSPRSTSPTSRVGRPIGSVRINGCCETPFQKTASVCTTCAR